MCEPVIRLSTMTTLLAGSEARRSARLLPMNPAPPVIRMDLLMVTVDRGPFGKEPKERRVKDHVRFVKIRHNPFGGKPDSVIKKQLLKQ